jgi:2-dehydro-3-deoxyphosphogluconate aldolase/(4S)-4-hydroxy-2-oxoglutarate aldolase
MSIQEKMKQLKVIPVVVIEESEAAIQLGKALINAGLPIIEITFRTAIAAEVISILTQNLPDLLVGAGTVLNIDQVKRAIIAGAQFIVTPGFNPNVVDFCVKKKIMIIPGLNTPTMVEWALERGITLVKFFPADLSGGTKMLKLLAGPYPSMRFMPTGGINNESMIEYLKLPNVLAVGGSWIVNKDLISAKKFDEIEKLTTETLSILKSKGL